jgi:hypothetical protein
LDDYLERDLIAGKFDNFGLELRILQHYPIGKKMKGVITYGADTIKVKPAISKDLQTPPQIPILVF